MHNLYREYTNEWARGAIVTKNPNLKKGIAENVFRNYDIFKWRRRQWWCKVFLKS